MVDVTGSSVWGIVDSFASQDPKKPSEATGTVSSVGDDGTIYVRIDGSTVETPVSGTYSNVKPGDDVKVTVYKGRASIAGNSTSPSVGATYVNEAVMPAMVMANDAFDAALVADDGAKRAHQAADEAAAVAEAIGQHFWADDNGVHVTEEEGDPTTKHNILITSLGILLRHAANYLASVTQSAIAFYDGLDVGTEGLAAHMVASFGSNGAQIGKASANHVVVDSNGMEVLSGSTSRAFFGSTARIGATASSHVSVDSTAVQFFADATNKAAEIGIDSGVSFLRLIDRYRYVSASTGGSGSSTKDNITVGSYGVNNSHHAGVNLIASGTSGQATLRVHDDDSEGASLDVTPNRVVVPQGVDFYARKDVYIGGALSIASPLAISSGGTGIADFGTVVSDDISTAVSVPTGTNESIGVVSLDSGTWLVRYCAKFDTNGTGRRQAVLDTTPDRIAATWQRYCGSETMAVTGGATILNGTMIRTVTADEAIYLTVFQSSGGALDVTGNLQAIKLG